MRRFAEYASAAALAATTGVHPALAQQWTCAVVRPGDTAARLAFRLTGDPANTRQPWFYIVEPSTRRLLPRSEYSRILPGWHACIARQPAGERVVLVRQQRQLEGGAPVQSPEAPGVPTIWTDRARLIFAGALLVLATLVGWHFVTVYSKGRRALVSLMTAFGERFIREFERPLVRPGSEARSLESRLRLRPRQKRLDIVLAPPVGRTYPNLSDHRKNVEYDVGRVVNVLKDDRFVVERLSGQGRSVVVQCRYRADLTPGGGP
jgi:hypothetical protein